MIAVVQARFSSGRLPGKVVKLIGARPMISWVVDRVKMVDGIDEVIVATSDHYSDDPIAAICKENNIDFFRGSLENVAKRFCDLINYRSIDTLVRICGDSPLIHPSVLKKAIELYEPKGPLVVTNLYPKTFPKGQSVEILNCNHFLKCYGKFNCQNDFEHVTPAVYRVTDIENIKNFSWSSDFSATQLSVDTQCDFDFVTEIHKNNPDLNYSLEEMVRMRYCFENKEIDPAHRVYDYKV